MVENVFFLDNACWNGGGCSSVKFKFSGPPKFCPGEYHVA